MRIFEKKLLQTRRKFAGILVYGKNFPTQYATIFAEKTYADAYVDRF